MPADVVAPALQAQALASTDRPADSDGSRHQPESPPQPLGFGAPQGGRAKARTKVQALEPTALLRGQSQQEPDLEQHNDRLTGRLTHRVQVSVASSEEHEVRAKHTPADQAHPSRDRMWRVATTMTFVRSQASTAPAAASVVSLGPVSCPRRRTDSARLRATARGAATTPPVRERTARQTRWAGRRSALGGRPAVPSSARRSAATAVRRTRRVPVSACRAGRVGGCVARWGRRCMVGEGSGRSPTL